MDLMDYQFVFVLIAHQKMFVLVVQKLMNLNRHYLKLSDQNKLGSKLSSKEKFAIEKEIEDKIRWLDENQATAQVNDFKTQQKVIESVVTPIMAKLYPGQQSLPSSDIPSTGDKANKDEFKLSSKEKFAIEKEIEDKIRWLDENQATAQVNDFKTQQKVIESVVTPIIAKLYPGQQSPFDSDVPHTGDEANKNEL
ncbi:unnamed protein product [Adineta steineri]|uniref:Uncharacterized protein n=1 Tax=Adineta steineri TaxID=433720 RepID=A0A815AT79_9BILA|nr:unnamed protein product [Adineta steineri]